MFPSCALLYKSNSLPEESAVSSGNRLVRDIGELNNIVVSSVSPQVQPQKLKKKRGLPGNPDPDAEVIALSPTTLLATNRFVCEICNKGFQRDQNLQLHRRGHNLPWKLKQRNSKDVKKKVYVCPEPTCVHHHASRALGDLTGIKKHYCRKHGEKKWKCDKCSKIYAVQSDWKAHSKICGTREYRCDCGTLFSRKDSFITHRAFCDALAEESARLLSSTNSKSLISLHSPSLPPLSLPNNVSFSPWLTPSPQNPSPSYSIATTTAATVENNQNPLHDHVKLEPRPLHNPPPLIMQPVTEAATSSPAALSATALLQKAATVGDAAVGGGAMLQSAGHHFVLKELAGVDLFMMSQLSTEYNQLGGVGSTWRSEADPLTRDFLGLTDHVHGNVVDDNNGRGAVHVSMDNRLLPPYAGKVGFPLSYGSAQPTSFQTPRGLGFAAPRASHAWGQY